MRLAVVGGTGALGGAVVESARASGHRAAALGSTDVDAADAASVRRAARGHDAVVAAVKGPDRLVPRAAAALLEGLSAAGVPRLVFVGGGGSLLDRAGRRFGDAPDFPSQYLATALDQAEALEVLRAATTEVAWTYLSPPPTDLVPGPPTGAFRLVAQDTPVVDEQGRSRISVGDLAEAVVRLAVGGDHAGRRVTAAY